MTLPLLPNCIRALSLNRHLIFNIIRAQQKTFTTNVIVDQQQPLDDKKKTKKTFIPKITLISSENVSITTLEEAQKLSKRRDLKLVKLIDVDTKTQRPVYKLMTGSELHAEELKHREEKKKEKASNNTIKGEKVLMINNAIGVNDLKTTLNKIIKWMNKRYEARIIISGDGNMEKAENVYKYLEDNLKDHGRILQKRIKGHDIKFSINPPKNNNKDKVDVL